MNWIFCVPVFIYRHKCPACFKQFKRKEHLIEHMKFSYHSVHEPKCVVCQKHCKSYESLREHLTGRFYLHAHSDQSINKFLSLFFFVGIGQRAKAYCSRIFSDLGCSLCLKLFENPDSLTKHKEGCCLSAPAPSVSWLVKIFKCLIIRTENLLISQWVIFFNNQLRRSYNSLDIYLLSCVDHSRE